MTRYSYRRLDTVQLHVARQGYDYMRHGTTRVHVARHGYDYTRRTGTPARSPSRPVLQATRPFTDLGQLVWGATRPFTDLRQRVWGKWAAPL